MSKSRAQKAKGDFLEDVVALLHETPNCKVEKRVRLPVEGDSSDSREIDILLSGIGLGYPIRIAIECKNWAKKIGAPAIDEFLGKLEDVGIPPALGVYVSASGYTRGAVRRAGKSGIRVLEITGLDEERISMPGASFEAITGQSGPWLRRPTCLVTGPSCGSLR